MLDLSITVPAASSAENAPGAKATKPVHTSDSDNLFNLIDIS
jgi:hypothetical protein